MKNGWYFNIGRKEYFVETERQNKTRTFAEKILDAIGAEKSDGNIKYILYSLIKAHLEIKHCPDIPDMGIKAHDYYNIFGKNFSGYGSDVEDGKTVILQIV